MYKPVFTFRVSDFKDFNHLKMPVVKQFHQALPRILKVMSTKSSKNWGLFKTGLHLQNVCSGSLERHFYGTFCFAKGCTFSHIITPDKYITL